MAINKISGLSTVTSIAFLSLISGGGYSVYIWGSEQGATHLHHLLNSKFLYAPPFLIGILEEPGILSVTAITITLSLHALAYSMVFTGITFTGTLFALSRSKSKEMSKADGSNETIKPSNENLSFHSKEARIVLMAYQSDPKNRFGASMKPVNSVFPEIYLKLTRRALSFNRPPVTPVDKLEAALMSILAAHKDWPADPHGHHSDRSLYDHSLDVAKRLKIATGNHPLATVIGLAHDIGKITAYHRETITGGSGKGGYRPNILARTILPLVPGLKAWLTDRAYKKNPQLRPVSTTRWTIKSKMHDKLSAHILRLLPEFQRLKQEEQITINTVVSYSHNYERTPKKHTTHVELDLIRKLREVDGLATADDQNRILDLAAQPEIISAVADALRRMIPALNINGVRGGFADGWTSRAQEYVAVQESVIRENLSGYLDAKMVSSLGLSMDKANHPATPVIRAALDSMGYLVKEYAGIEPRKNIFSIKSGKQSFHGIFLLKREALESTMGDTVAGWGDCSYPLKIIHRHKEGDDDQTLNHRAQTPRAATQSV